MFKDLKEGQTHSYGDRCGEKEHNDMKEDKKCYCNCQFSDEPENKPHNKDCPCYQPLQQEECKNHEVNISYENQAQTIIWCIKCSHSVTINFMNWKPEKTTSKGLWKV